MAGVGRSPRCEDRLRVRVALRVRRPALWATSPGYAPACSYGRVDGAPDGARATPLVTRRSRPRASRRACVLRLTRLRTYGRRQQGIAAAMIAQQNGLEVVVGMAAPPARQLVPQLLPRGLPGYELHHGASRRARPPRSGPISRLPPGTSRGGTARPQRSGSAGSSSRPTRYSFSTAAGTASPRSASPRQARRR